MIFIFFITFIEVRSIVVSCPAQCKTNLDCSLNGNCLNGVCGCDSGWTGTCCGQLDLAPVNYSLTNGGYRHPLTSTWGGNILQDADKKYHMWIAEMKPFSEDGAGSCGLTTWGSNSQITHVSSAAVGGPYTREEVAVGLWSHNPIVRQIPETGLYVLWHIGGGDSTNSTPPKGYCALNGTSPCGEQSFDKCGAPFNPCNMTPAGFDCTPQSCVGSGGNCGPVLSEPTLSCDKDSWEACIPLAAAACEALPQCAFFSMSSDWLGLNRVKLFAAGAVTTPNTQWTSWSRKGTRETSSCTLSVHSSPTTAGPWTAQPNVTIEPCAGNNPGPWVHPNGTIYIIFTEQVRVFVCVLWKTRAAL